VHFGDLVRLPLEHGESEDRVERAVDRLRRNERNPPIQLNSAPSDPARTRVSRLRPSLMRFRINAATVMRLCCRNLAPSTTQAARACP